MRIFTKKCGDHYHAALVNEYDEICIETVGMTEDEAVYKLDLAIMADILAMLGLSEDEVYDAPAQKPSFSHLN